MNRKRRKNNLQNLLLIFISILLIPLLFSLIVEFPLLFSNYQKLNETMFYSLIGFIFFTGFYLLTGQPVRTYIIAHELSHMIFAIFTGTRIKSVSFRKDNSYVKTGGSNVFVSLGPYILPLYSIVLILIYKMILIIIGYSKFISIIFYFIIGAGYSFHILSTVHYLKYDQPDMKRYGYFFSLTFVMVWLIVISALLFSLMFSKVELVTYLLKSLYETKQIYMLLLGFLPHIRNI